MPSILFCIKLYCFIVSLLIKGITPLLRSYYEKLFFGFYMEIQIAYPTQKCLLNLDISSSFTRLSSRMYYSKFSKTNTILPLSPSSLSYMSNEIKGFEIEDIVSIGDDKYSISSKLSFIHMNYSMEFITPNAIGLQFEFVNESFSFIHRLKADGIIDDLSFSLVAFGRSAGSLYYGGIPIENIVNKSVSSCNVKSRNGLWDCNMQGIIINNKTYLNDEAAYITFNSILQNIEAPIAFEQLLLNVYLKDTKMGTECNYTMKTNEEKELLCLPSYISQLPNITFVIDNYSYSFNSDLLFVCFSRECIFKIVIPSNRTNWLFGLHFLSNFDLLFSYENRKISFYSNSNANIIHEYNRTLNDTKLFSDIQYMMIIIIICIIVLLIGIFVIIVNHKIF